LRVYFLASVVLLGVGIVLGIAAIAYYPGLAQKLENELTSFIKLFRSLPKLQLVGAIFLNNALKSLIVIVLGAFFGLLPIVFLVVNGAAIGVAVVVSSQARGVWQSILFLMPHGLLELPAVLLATSIGLMLGGHLVRRIFGETATTLTHELGAALKFFLTIIVPILIVAAVVEVFVTPVVAGI
jgi:stage II sporulation protein M